MAVKYVKSTTGSDSNGGTSWADAYATLAKALGVIAAGDTVYVSQAHAETQGSSITLTSPGTAGNPCRIICSNDGATPPTATATTATVTCTGISNLFFNGYAYCYGITFACATGGTGGVIEFSNNANTGWIMDTCKLTMPNTGAGNYIRIGSATSGVVTFVRWINTTVKFASSGQQIRLEDGVFSWENTPTAVDTGGTVPTTLFNFNTLSCIAEVSGVDLSALASGKNLVTINGVQHGRLKIRNCKLGSSVSVITGTIASPASEEVLLENSDSSNTNYRMEHYKYQGKILGETTVVMTSGASDGTTPISHKFVSLTSGPTLFQPLLGPWMNIWNDTTGSSKTVTVEFLHDSLTNLQNADIYLEVEGLATSSFPKSIWSNNRVTDVFATPSDCPAGTGSGNWTTTGLTNPNSQNLQVSFTPQVKGPIRVRVCLVKNNYTVYVNPQLTVV